MTQRPDLCAAALPAVGVMDMLRYHKFTIGWAWTSDYGSPDNPDDFDVLYACSPYHNLKEGASYPATLITTGIDDPEPNDEIRISNLIFVFGLGVDQVVVNGSGFYPAAGPTIDLDSTLIRPVTGGSGVFAGTSGWAETRHFPDDSWEHTFHLLIPEQEDRRGRHRGGRNKRH